MGLESSHPTSVDYLVKAALLCLCFSLDMSYRNGTDVDAKAAVEVFSKLGYKIKFFNDQTVGQMRQLMLSGN